MIRTPRVVRRASLGPREADEPHRVLPPQPPAEPPRPAPVDALGLLHGWRRAKLEGNPARAAALLAELEKLAERPPHTEGEHDGIRD